MRLFFIVGALQLALGLFQFFTDGSSVLAWWNIGLAVFWFMLSWRVKRHEDAADDNAKREAGTLMQGAQSPERNWPSPQDPSRR